MTGQSIFRYGITGMTNAKPCVVTTDVNALTTGQFVRITDINSAIPVPRGLDQLNDKKYRIVVIDTSNFSLQDPITFEDVDTTTYPTYVTGGQITLVQPEFIYEGA